MSMRYTGRQWGRMRKASGDTLIERIRQAKYNEARSKLRKGKSVHLSMMKRLQKEVKEKLYRGLLIVSGRW